MAFLAWTSTCTDPAYGAQFDPYDSRPRGTERRFRDSEGERVEIFGNDFTLADDGAHAQLIHRGRHIRTRWSGVGTKVRGER
jgi:hypothetical protein